MGASLTLGRVKGIKIRVHWTFYLLLAWIVFLEVSRGSSLESMLWSVAFILVLFGCVVLHELGHSLTAMRFGISTRQITLLPIGGVASLEKMPEDPWEELLVALAGPAVNVIIALVLWMLLPVGAFFSQNPEALQEALSVINAGNFLYLLLSANLLLVAFNMIPAFPMDGGRVLRALLAMRMDRVRATRAAALLGQGLAVLFFLVGIVYNPILALVGVFIYFGARSESAMEEQMVVLRGRTVREAMMTDVTLVDPQATIGEVIDLILDGTERDFVVSSGREVEGVLYETDLIRAWRSRGQDVPVHEVMVRGVKAVSAGDPLKEVISRLQEGRSFLPVVEDGRPVGAIDTNNLSEFIVFRATTGMRSA
ncbi:MAG: site-2 protease family protein [Balneolaceae bacterium]|nr:site-2 protease family protein [Balneolaceae bacterium]